MRSVADRSSPSALNSIGRSVAPPYAWRITFASASFTHSAISPHAPASNPQAQARSSIALRAVARLAGSEVMFNRTPGGAGVAIRVGESL